MEVKAQGKRSNLEVNQCYLMIIWRCVVGTVKNRRWSEMIWGSLGMLVCFSIHVCLSSFQQIAWLEIKDDCFILSWEWSFKCSSQGWHVSPFSFSPSVGGVVAGVEYGDQHTFTSSSPLKCCEVWCAQSREENPIYQSSTVSHIIETRRDARRVNLQINGIMWVFFKEHFKVVCTI